MDAEFWHKKWEKNEIAFHAAEPNPFLTAYFDRLSLPQGSRVFLPLCGKTLDIAWLLSQGYGVAGAELSRIAIEQLFAELHVEPEIKPSGKLERFRGEDLDIFVGDLFDLSAETLGPVDAVWDRAALVALPGDLRVRYARHLAEITRRAPQLLVCYDYDQSLQPGPPFAVGGEEVMRHYGEDYALTQLANVSVPGGLRGKCAAQENLWLLKGKDGG